MLVLIMSWAVFMLIRIERVNKYRGDMIEKISLLNKQEIKEKGTYDRWRWDAYESVSYQKMAHTFWKSFDSFYEDNNPLRETK